MIVGASYGMLDPYSLSNGFCVKLAEAQLHFDTKAPTIEMSEVWKSIHALRAQKLGVTCTALLTANDTLQQGKPALSQNGQFVAIPGAKKLNVVDVQGNNHHRYYEFSAPYVAFFGDELFAMIEKNEEYYVIHDTPKQSLEKTGVQTYTSLAVIKKPVHSFAIAPSGLIAVGMTLEGVPSVGIFDSVAGKLFQTPIACYQTEAPIVQNGCVWHSSKSIFAVKLGDRSIHLYDCRAQKKIEVIKNVRNKDAFDFNADGSYICTTDILGDITIWDIGQQKLRATSRRCAHEGVLVNRHSNEFLTTIQKGDVTTIMQFNTDAPDDKDDLSIPTDEELKKTTLSDIVVNKHTGQILLCHNEQDSLRLWYTTCSNGNGTNIINPQKHNIACIQALNYAIGNQDWSLLRKLRDRGPIKDTAEKDSIFAHVLNTFAPPLVAIEKQ